MRPRENFSKSKINVKLYYFINMNISKKIIIIAIMTCFAIPSFAQKDPFDTKDFNEFQKNIKAMLDNSKGELKNQHIKSKINDPIIKQKDMLGGQKQDNAWRVSENSNNRIELIFHEINEKDISIIKINKESDAWLKGYVKASKELGSNDEKNINGYKVPKWIYVSSYKDDRFGNQDTTVLRAASLGPGFDEVIIVFNNQYMSRMIVENSQNKKLFIVKTKIESNLYNTIRVQEGKKMRHIYSENIVTDAFEIIQKCNLDTDYFKENTYKVMIDEGVANLNGYKVLEYRTGGAPELGHSYLIKAPKIIIDKSFHVYPFFKNMKFPFNKKISNVCIAKANIIEPNPGETWIGCGCNIE
jgi:hypothetical protein